MARPSKIGLDYFPLDVDFFNDEKIGAISGEFGIKGELACIKLLCAIYRNGYFARWNEVLRMKLIKELPGVSADLLETIVSRAVRWGLFDKALFDDGGILTSSGIQRRYFEATKRRIGEEGLPYLLVSVCRNGVNVCNNGVSVVSVSNNSINVDINTQSKGKESKVVTTADSIMSINSSNSSNGSGSFVARATAKPKTKDELKSELQKRATAFGKSLIPFTQTYGKDMVRAFFDYWTEPNKSFTKLRFELNQTWDLPRRLRTWASREPINKQQNEQKEQVVIPRGNRL